MKVESPNLLRRELEPFLEMLEERSKTLSREQWVEMVTSTAERIATVPEQYLAGPIKPSVELQQAIHQIFRESLN